MLARTRMFFAVVREIFRTVSIRKIAAAAITEALHVQGSSPRNLKVEYPEFWVRGGEPECVVKFSGIAQFGGFVSPVRGEIVFVVAQQQWRALGVRSVYSVTNIGPYPLNHEFGPDTPYRYARKGELLRRNPPPPQYVH